MFMLFSRCFRLGVGTVATAFLLSYLGPLSVRSAKAGDEVGAVVPAVVGDDGGQLPERPGVGLHGQRLLSRGVGHLNLSRERANSRREGPRVYYNAPGTTSSRVGRRQLAVRTKTLQSQRGWFRHESKRRQQRREGQNSETVVA